ncbi:PAS domain S-box protein [Planctomyces sp. SH-PL62]|uniref:hybrid sensor histidine kinase/response regulator n=1 Tax=Planctomyces sp. SH-PL62 TaxID=1636152 RepID=UPI00078D251C|nr:PAS domain S-box protein [Planctomyces sp. SH-PL62]AMV36190.1 Autoinducer 2 sensor kinase/phosphatase LuxQ [Planctomyces sp. SH-PL62]
MALKSSRRRRSGRYLMILPAVAVAAGLTAATWPLCERAPWAFFLGAVMATGWLGGLIPCALTTALSVVVGSCFFLPPYGTFGFQAVQFGAVGAFVIVSGFIAFFSAAYRDFEEKDRGHRRRFEAMARSLAEGLVTTDGEGRVTFLNPAAERLTGWPAPEAQDRPIDEVFSLRVEGEPASWVGDARRGVQEIRGVLLGRDGVERPVEGSAAPIRDESSTAGVVLSFRDVGERLAAEAALHQSEELNRKLVGGSVDRLEMLDPEGRLLAMNDYGRRLMEAEDFESLRGREWASLWPEAMRATVREAVRKAAQGGVARFAGPGPTLRGAPRDWEVHLSPLLAADGSPERISCIARDVTERKRAEREVQASERRYRTLFESIDEGFCVIEMIYDEDGRAVDYAFLETNPAFETHTGLVEARGKRMRELVPDHDDHWFRTYAQVVATGRPLRFVDRAEKLGGAWFDLYAMPMEGRKVAVLFKNVSEAIRAEQERERLLLSLKLERGRLASLIQDAPAFICTLRGPDHVFELTNSLYREMVGNRDLIGKPVQEAFPDLEGQGFFELLDQVYRTGETFVGKETPIRFRHRGSSEADRRVLNFVFQAMYDPDGEVSGIFVHGVDVTDAVAAREALRESEARFRQLADAMPQAVWTARADGAIDYSNRQWRQYGSPPEGVLGDSRWARLIHPDDRERTHAIWLESLRTGRPFETEYRLRREFDGSYRWHLGRALPIEDSQARIVRWFGTSTDVDDVKRLSEALQQADRRKDEFLATLAHELRNPLAPIRTGLEILRHCPDPTSASTTIDMMARQLSHMVHLIDDLMDVARVGSGKISLRKEPTTLQAIVSGAVEASRQIIDSARHSLTVSLPDEPLPLDADPTRLTQVVANLLNNAAKYTEPGGRIGLAARREGDEAVVTVRDTGIGLAPEMLSKVFDMFTQVDGSLDRSQGGLGIGLTIVKRLVEMHGGRIDARSAGIGRGSDFIVRLPLAGAPAAVPGDPGADENRTRAGGLRVLVVDDNRDSANSLSRLLALGGHEVHTAYAGVQAIAEASAYPPDVILLDLGLPDRNGFAVAAELRATPAFHGTTIVALTGWGQPEDRRRSREAGFDDHLVKPVDIEQLRAILDSVAENGRRRPDGAVAVVEP